MNSPQLKRAIHLPAFASPGRCEARDAAATAATLEDLEEPDWLEPPCKQAASPPPREWLFWGFLICMAITAFPLLGIRWTTPEWTRTYAAFEDAVLLGLPVLAALPFLFAGCLGALARHAAARTPTAFGAFAAAMVIGIAAVHALTS